MRNPISSAEKILIGALQPFAEKVLNQLLGPGWRDVAGDRHHDVRAAIWDVPTLLWILETHWEAFKPLFVEQCQKTGHKEAEVNAIVRALRQMRNRAYHQPKTQFQEADAITFVGFSEKLLRLAGLDDDGEKIYGIYLDLLRDERVSATTDAHERHQPAERPSMWNDLCLLGELVRRERSRLWRAGKSYYGSVDQTPDWPLVAKREWLPPVPIAIRELEKRLAWQPRVSPARPVMLPAFEAHHLADALRAARPSIQIANNHCYRATGIDVPDSGAPAIAFAPCYYDDYVNTCEAYAYGLAEWFTRHGRVPSPGDAELILHGRPEDIYDLSSRNVSVGLSALTVFVASDDTLMFAMQRRNEKVLEAPNTNHVVPAGTFQSDSWEDAFHTRDFSLHRTIVRELAEEMFGIEELSGQCAKGTNFLAAAKNRLFQEALQQSAVFYLGMGMDPVTLKLEMLFCLLWPQLPSHMVEFNGAEGDIFWAEWSREALTNFGRSERTLAAGAACVLQAAEHFDELTSTFLSLSHEMRASGTYSA